jgi:hypothetical protein
VRTRILESPSLTHEFSYFLRKIDPSDFPTEHTVSNGLAFQHQFTKEISGRARLAREDGQERTGRRSANIFTASVMAVPLDTLSNSLVYSLIDETLAGNTSVTHSLFLYNVAKLYEGIDLSIGGGGSHVESGAGQKTLQTQINGGATLVPHSAVTVNLLYTGSASTTSGGDVPGERKSSNDSWEANVTVTPIPTLYLSGSYRVDSRSAGDARTTGVTKSYVVNFSPFPYGTLHLNFTYSETLRSEDNSRQTIVTPSLRWNITPRSSLDLSYLKVTTDRPVLSEDSGVASGTFRMNF